MVKRMGSTYEWYSSVQSLSSLQQVTRDWHPQRIRKNRRRNPKLRPKPKLQPNP